MAGPAAHTSRVRTLKCIDRRAGQHHVVGSHEQLRPPAGYSTKQPAHSKRSQALTALTLGAQLLLRGRRYAYNVTPYNLKPSAHSLDHQASKMPALAALADLWSPTSKAGLLAAFW